MKTAMWKQIVFHSPFTRQIFTMHFTQQQLPGRELHNIPVPPGCCANCGQCPLWTCSYPRGNRATDSGCCFQLGHQKNQAGLPASVVVVVKQTDWSHSHGNWNGNGDLRLPEEGVVNPIRLSWSLHWQWCHPKLDISFCAFKNTPPTAGPKPLHSPPHLPTSTNGTPRTQGRIQDFGQGGPAEFLPKGGGLSPKFAQNRVFPLKLPENCVKKNRWGKGGPGPQVPLDPQVGL